MINLFFDRITVSLPFQETLGRRVYSAFNQFEKSNSFRTFIKSLKLKSNRMMEAIGKIMQNNYSSEIGFIPKWAVSLVGQNVGFYAKFAVARAVQNQNWLSGLNVTLRY